MARDEPISARNLLMDLLRASEPDAWPVKVLVEVAALFDIRENALRVNLTRLLSRGLLEQDNRGFYRLAPTTSPFQQWINAWSQGEDRVVQWQGGWLALAIDPVLNAKPLALMSRALHRFGFRPLMQRYWVRPDNLATPLTTLSCRIVQMGRSDQFVLATAESIFLGAGETTDLSSLWDIAELEHLYRTHLDRLGESLRELQYAPLEQVLRETFLYGGEAIRVLALDPLLPAQMIDTEPRRALGDVMRVYDQTFRTRWREHFGIDNLSLCPAVAE